MTNLEFSFIAQKYFQNERVEILHMFEALPLLQYEHDNGSDVVEALAFSHNAGADTLMYVEKLEVCTSQISNDILHSIISYKTKGQMLSRYIGNNFSTTKTKEQANDYLLDVKSRISVVASIDSPLNSLPYFELVNTKQPSNYQRNVFPENYITDFMCTELNGIVMTGECNYQGFSPDGYVLIRGFLARLY